jgi:hypothetical protein
MNNQTNIKISGMLISQQCSQTIDEAVIKSMPEVINHVSVNDSWLFQVEVRGPFNQIIRNSSQVVAWIHQGRLRTKL